MKKFICVLMLLLFPSLAFSEVIVKGGGMYIPEYDLSAETGVLAGEVNLDGESSYGGMIGLFWEKDSVRLGITSSFERLESSIAGVGVPVDVSMDTFTIMGEGCLAPSMGSLTPYGCLGLGVMSVDPSATVGIPQGDLFIDVEQSGFVGAYKATAGLEFSFTDNLSMYGEGGWLATFSPIAVSAQNIGLATGELNVDHPFLGVGVVYRF